MVSLAIGKGKIKKMMHVPSLKIYCVKEVPINSRENRNSLKKTIQNWEEAIEKEPSNGHLIGIKGVHWNTPEGCVSLVFDYMNGGSLLNMLQSSGAMPEEILRQIAKQVLQGLEFLHT